ncbi:hypothetical protein C5B42_00500 [Candidatus Cerribacteria bacterium 'Amazon FNV 2010 28 9']|uniref:Uncharacterized protein n=1 Tax=Candidatus Cerribacteria bacterium 'Amazon FNV 2010 28 9' TaxID=2081795 RepID=A0A317JRK8_9BACT|nr:MAG: hypothetical protein C5B42_00500 [Candidatus Cerribacteria bacterium 'Amazon FNV 2010 28 9']
MATAQPQKPVTLTQTAFVARRAVVVFGITLLVYVVGRFFIDSFTQYWIATHPTPPPPPTHGFGILPKIAFPTNVGTPTSYKLELPPDRLAPPSDRAYVFFMPSQRASLLALSKAKQQAQDLGFLLEPQQITNDVYRWSHSQPLPATLDYNIVNGTFTQKLDWQSDPTFLQTNQLPNEDDAIAMTRTMLQAANLLGQDIATGSAKITYLKAGTSGYTPTVSLSESDFLQVDIFRTQILGTYDVVTDAPTHGAVRAIITGKQDTNLRFAMIDYKYLPVDYTSAFTYSIISPSEAFVDLRAGKGYTAAMSQSGTDVTIRTIRLGYYDSFTPQSYLQPIYILEGDGGYIGYVSAVSPTWEQQ